MIDTHFFLCYCYHLLTLNDDESEINDADESKRC